MWIRSQDGKSLTDCDSFAVERFFEQYEVVTLSNRSGISVALGIYSSEEKALKVLNGIQDAIEDTFYYNIENLGCGSYALKKGCEIYEMPQDEGDF